MIDPRLSQMPLTMLQQAVLGQVPGVHPYAALSRINQMVTDNQAKVAQQGQAAMGANAQQQQQPPVAQQVMQASMQPMDQGIGSIPTRQNYANGGIVAFADGGSPEDDDFFSEQVNTGGASPIPYHTPKPSAERDRLNSIPADVLRYITEAITGPKFLGDPRLSYNMQSAKEATVKGKEDTRQQAAQEAFRRWELPQNNTASPPAGIASLAPVKRAPAQQGGILRPQVSAPAMTPPTVDFTDKQKALDDYLTKMQGQVDADYTSEKTLTPEMVSARAAANAQREKAGNFREQIAGKQQAMVDKQQARLDAREGQNPLSNLQLLGAMAGGAKGKTFGDVLSGAAGAGGTELGSQEKINEQARQNIYQNQNLVYQAQVAKQDYDVATKEMDVAQANGDRSALMTATTKRNEAYAKMGTIKQAQLHFEQQAQAQIQFHAANNASAERIAAGTQAAMRYRADAETGKLSDKAEKDDTMAVQKQISNVMTLAKSGGLANAIGYAAANEQGKNKIIQDAVMGNLTPSQQAIFGRMVLTSAQPGAGATPSGWGAMTRN